MIKQDGADCVLSLLPPSEIYKEEITAYRQAFLASGEYMDGCGALRKIEDPLAYIENCRLRADSKTAAEAGGHAMQWICVRKTDQRIVGMIQYRYQADDEFKIGYCVRPDERGKGYAQWMLAQILAWCRSRNLKEVLIACEKSNAASRSVIVKSGGMYEKARSVKNIELEIYRFKL